MSDPVVPGPDGRRYRLERVKIEELEEWRVARRFVVVGPLTLGGSRAWPPIVEYRKEEG